MIRLLMDWLFPPPWESKNAQMARLLCAHPLPPPRARAVEPMSAVEREQTAAVETALREIENASARDWMGRR